MTWQSVPIILFGIAQLIALARAYYGLKADNAALAANLAITILTERTARQAEHSAIRDQVMSVIATVQESVVEVTHRVTTLETGQDEWTKTLRARTHDLSNQVNTLVLKVDRLERPSGEAPS